MSLLRVYDVELLVVEKATGAERTATRREHAHDVMDAVVQASLNVCGDGLVEVRRTVRVGPPADLAAAADASMQSQIDRLLAGIGGRR